MSQIIANPEGRQTFAANGGSTQPAGQTQTNTSDRAAPDADLRAEFSRVHAEATGIIDTATAAGRELTAEEKAANDNRFSRLSAIKSVLDDRVRFASIALAAHQSGDPDRMASAPGTIELPREVPGRAEYEASRGRDNGNAGDDEDPAALKPADRAKFSREVKQYAMTGDVGPMARKFATITTSTGSGIILPRTIGVPIAPTTANAFRAAHVLNGVKPIETNNTAALTIPVLDATAGGIVAENASTDTENAGISEKMVLDPKTFQSGSAWFSNQQLAANDFDILANVVPNLTYTKELGVESAIAAALIADSGITQTVTAASTSTLTYANLVALNRRLSSRYDTQKAIILSRDAFAYAEGIVGSDGHPVLVLDPQGNGLVRFNGTPVLRCDFFESFGATKVIGVVVSLLGFRIRDVTVQNLARYTNIPTRPNQTGLNLFAYHGYGWAPSAVAKLVTPGS